MATGWLSLTFNKDPKSAYKYFSKMFLEVKTPISKARASYWAGKASEEIGNKEDLKYGTKEQLLSQLPFMGN